MLKVGFLYENKLAHLTQWGVKSDTCVKKFIHNPGSATKQIKGMDCAFINKTYPENIVEQIKKMGYPIVYFYGDYRVPLNTQTLNFMKMADLVLLTWYQKDIYKKYNSRTVSQGVNPEVWKPVLESESIYDVVFTGSNYGSKIRYNIVEQLNRDFNFVAVGRNWGPGINHLLKHSPTGTNRILNLGKVNVGIFNNNDLSDLKYYTSNRLYQGMASGRPHIGPYTRGLKSRFKPEDFYLYYKSYKNLKSQINILINNPNLRDQISIDQRNAIKQNYTVYHAWKRMEDLIVEII